MSDQAPATERFSKRVRAMYNAHPFPNRYGIPPAKSDERFRFIYSNFLHFPLGSFKGGVFLDAGCGTGDNTWNWRRLLDPSTQVVAVDLSQASVRIARQAGQDYSVRPAFSVGSLLDLGLADESVDVVFCSGVLVAVTDPDRAYRELTRVLKPGGYMILVLYHRYGRFLHGLRRSVVDLLEREDVDRRARLGGQLFGRSMRKLAAAEQSPFENVLYDQFGLPCESRYSVGQALRWFQQSSIQYLGTWPPVEWSQFGKALRFAHRLSGRRDTIYYSALTRLFADSAEAPQRPPNWLTRSTMQTAWALDQLQLFAISGRKLASPAAGSI